MGRLKSRMRLKLKLRLILREGEDGKEREGREVKGVIKTDGPGKGQGRGCRTIF